MNAVGKPAELRLQLRGIGKGDACRSIARISAVEELIRLLSATMIYKKKKKEEKKNFAAKHVFVPFSEVSSDSKPVKKARN